jgi:hypothetical protein
MKYVVRWGALVAVIAAIGVISGPVTSSAAPPPAPMSCLSGQLCIWSQTGFNGTRNFTTSTGGAWNSVGIMVQPRSAFNNSNSGNPGGLRMVGGTTHCWPAGNGDTSFNDGAGGYQWRFPWAGGC